MFPWNVNSKIMFLWLGGQGGIKLRASDTLDRSSALIWISSTTTQVFGNREKVLWMCEGFVLIWPFIVSINCTWFKLIAKKCVYTMIFCHLCKTEERAIGALTWEVGFLFLKRGFQLSSWQCLSWNSVNQAGFELRSAYLCWDLKESATVPSLG